MPGSPATPRAPDSPPGARLALVVATSTYTDPGLRRLRAPTRDAADLAQVLADSDIGGFTVTTVIDQPTQQIRLAIEDFLHDRGTADLLLVYLSCHGKLDDYRRLYFAATDTRLDRLGSTGVESAWVLDQLEHCRARRQILILDCCFSGAFAYGAKGEADLGLQDRFLGHGRGRVVLTASTATEYSFEENPHMRPARAGRCSPPPWFRACALVPPTSTTTGTSRSMTPMPTSSTRSRRRARPRPRNAGCMGPKDESGWLAAPRDRSSPPRPCPNHCGPAWTAPTRASVSAP
jgi:Caspase domain